MAGIFVAFGGVSRSESVRKKNKKGKLGLETRQTRLEPVFQVVAAAISIIQPVVVVAATIIAVILSR